LKREVRGNQCSQPAMQWPHAAKGGGWMAGRQAGRQAGAAHKQGKRILKKIRFWDEELSLWG
jgi:hypothetical protein